MILVESFVNNPRFGETAPVVKDTDALAEDLGSIPSTCVRQLHDLCISSSRNLTPSSGLLEYCTHEVHIQMGTYTNVYVTIYLKISKNE